MQETALTSEARELEGSVLGLQEVWHVCNMRNVEVSEESDGGKERVWGQVKGASGALLQNQSYGSRTGEPLVNLSRGRAL